MNQFSIGFHGLACMTASCDSVRYGLQDVFAGLVMLQDFDGARCKMEFLEYKALLCWMMVVECCSSVWFGGWMVQAGLGSWCFYSQFVNAKAKVQLAVLEEWPRIMLFAAVLCWLGHAHDSKRARLLCAVLGMTSFLSLFEALLTASSQSEFSNP